METQWREAGSTFEKSFKSGAHIAELLARVRAYGGNRHEAYDDDERQHNGIFNRRRAIFSFDEADYVFHEVAHVPNPFHRVEKKKLNLQRPPVRRDWLTAP